MKYFVAIETLQVVEVDALSESQAVEKVNTQLKVQDPKSTAKVSIVKEVNC